MHVFVQKIIILCPHVGLHGRAEPGPCIQQSSSCLCPPETCVPWTASIFLSNWVWPVADMLTLGNLWSFLPLSKRHLYTEGGSNKDLGPRGHSWSHLRATWYSGNLAGNHVTTHQLRFSCATGNHAASWALRESSHTHICARMPHSRKRVCKSRFALASFHLEAHKFLFVLIK